MPRFRKILWPSENIRTLTRKMPASWTLPDTLGIEKRYLSKYIKRSSTQIFNEAKRWDSFIIYIPICIRQDMIRNP